MSKAPSFDDIFAVMSAASVGNLAARVATPEHAQLDDTATRFAIALKILLDDLTLSNANGQRELAERGRLADRFELLSEAAREFSAATADLAHLLTIVARRLGELVGDLCVIRTVSDDGEWLEPTEAVYHRDPAMVAATRALVARDVASHLRASDAERSVVIDVQDGLTAEMDARLARALVDNLLGNAWKFTRKAPHARIAFGAGEKGESGSFFMRDNGAGFDMAFASKLFALSAASHG